MVIMKKPRTPEQQERQDDRILTLWVFVCVIGFLLTFTLLLILMPPEIPLIITLVGLIALVVYLNIKEP